MKEMTNGQTLGLLEATKIIYDLTKNEKEFKEAITKIQIAIEKGVTATADQAER